MEVNALVENKILRSIKEFEEYFFPKDSTKKKVIRSKDSDLKIGLSKEFLDKLKKEISKI